MHKELTQDLFTTRHSQLASLSVMLSQTHAEVNSHRIGDGFFSGPRHNPIHYHDFFEIFWLHSYSKTMDIIINNRPFTLKGGQMAILPMALRHCLTSVAPGSNGQRLNFSFEFLRKAIGIEAQQLFFNLANIRPWVHNGNLHRLILTFPEDIQLQLNRLTNELEEISNLAKKEQLNRASVLIDTYNAELEKRFRNFYLVFLKCFYSLCSEQELKAFDKYSLPLIRVINYVEDHLTEQIKLSDVCDLVGLKSTRFSTVFREIVGFSLVDYINFMRSRKARFLLLNTDTKISEIGEMCGFNSPIYFDRIFKINTGCTPKMFRTEYILEWQE